MHQNWCIIMEQTKTLRQWQNYHRLTLLILNCTCPFARSRDRRPHTNQHLFSGAAASVRWQRQRPSEAGSSTLHHGYSMKTVPASCWLEPAVHKTPAEYYAPHCLSSVQYICGYIVTLQYSMHWRVQNHPAHVCTRTNLYHHRDLSSHPGIYSYSTCPIWFLCVIPEMICILMHLNLDVIRH